MNARQILQGLGWSTLATLLTAVCQMFFMAALARLLDPAAFGLMAMAMIALRFASYFSQMGFVQAIIQRPHLDAQDTSAALVMALGLGSGLYGLIVLAAPLFAAGFRTPELAPLVKVLGVSLLLSSVGGLPLALLRRQGRFKRVSGIEVVSFVLGYGAVGIACASRGRGVWSLVTATLSQQLLSTLFGFLAVRYPLSWPLSRQALSRLWAYGSRYSLIGFLEFLSANVESLFIGRVLGKIELGLFNRATMLSNLPVEFGVSTVNKVLFPALAKMQGERDKLADGFLILLLGIGLLSTSIACGVAAAAPDLVALLLGPKWLSVAPLVTIVAFAVPPTFMYVACGLTLDSLAALHPKLQLQAGVLVLRAATVLLLSRWGLSGIACAAVLSEALRLALGMRLVGRLLHIAAIRLWSMTALMLLTGLSVSLLVRLAVRLGQAGALPLPGRVVLDVFAGALALLVCAALLVLRFPTYAPLQRFDALRRWQSSLLRVLQPRGARP